MGMNSAKIPVSFKFRNRVYRELHAVAQLSGKSKTSIVQAGTIKQLRAERRELRKLGG